MSGLLKKASQKDISGVSSSIEKGNNSNGLFYKDSDGILFCGGIIEVESGEDIAFPKMYKFPPIVTFNLLNLTTNKVFPYIQDVTKLKWTPLILDEHNNPSKCLIHWQAFGEAKE